jgi:SSS family solute:Na+ symporter
MMGWYLIYVSVYFLFMFGVGIYYFIKVKTSDEYLIAGWNMGFWNIVGTIISTNCGAAVFIGWVGMGFTMGVSGFFKFAFPAMLVSMLLIIVFSRPLRRQKLYTLADLFSERFGSKTGIIPSVLSAFIYSVPTTALQIVGMSTVFKIAFGIEIKLGILLSFALILAFTILGGLVATIITDAIQSVVLIIGIVLLAIATYKFSGGFVEIIGNTPSEFLTPLGANGLSDVLLFALSIAPFYLVWQSTWQRIFASKTEEVAIKAGLTGFGITLCISVLPYSIGLMARQFIPSDIKPDLIFSYITVEMLPPYLGGIIIIGLLSALMTGADSFILQGSSNITKDLYHRLLNPKATEKQLMVVSRLSVVIVSVLSVIVAFFMTDIISMYQWALRLSATTLVIPFLAIMFWKRTTNTGVIVSMLLACLTTLLWPHLNTGIDQTIPGFIVSILTLMIVSKLTSHSATEQIKAVYWEDLSSAETRTNDNTPPSGDHTISG